ncbi:energy-coupling factor ABC transporter ATP-binding protein [Ligilactobacillus equi]|uniref:ABC transport ATP-binding protein n=1 Tax=Ligilactobacillus equi DSM 15833 = JCM 10991 TaxID=1423740 RepID=A0A0R1T7L0_9LACO|nr:energy-coupling factor ABC transporter ATP-binding protein [Ligilactobacillus equi]KRL77129.1 ABC transport ATP-binding protein [Ligilactobacillus equi DSM 15833 = JCM 10991]
MSEVIKIKNLTYRYDEEQSKPTLDNLNLTIEAGQWVALIGHNGSGKSTLTKLLDGLLVADQGQIEVADLVLNEETVWDVRANIGIVFQNPDNQFVGADVEGDVAFGLENQGTEHSEMVKRVTDALEAVNMSAFAKKQPEHLSGGQKQRVAIAGVLALRPKIIIFDEATSMLDPKGRREIVQMMQQLNHEEGFTVISITHDIDEAALADRIIVLNDGVITLDGQPTEVFQHAQELEAMGLGLPYSEQLKQALKAEGLATPSQYLDEEGMVDWLWQLLSKN